jgi:hypothetical protein
MRLFLGSILISFNLFAAHWSNLETNTHYKLTQNFQLPQIERSGARQDFSKGDDLLLKEITSLDMISVQLYEFEYKKCPGPAMKTDMEIISVQETSPVIEVGAQLENCVLSIYVETKDIHTKSFIE